MYKAVKGDKIDDSVKELSSELLSKVDYCLCKCQAKYLVSQAKNETKDDAQINSASDPKNAKMKSIEFDNVYDILFDDALKQKPDQNTGIHVTQGYSRWMGKLVKLGKMKLNTLLDYRGGSFFFYVMQNLRK